MMCQCQAYKLTSLTTEYFPISMTTVFLSHLLFGWVFGKHLNDIENEFWSLKLFIFFACFDSFIFWNVSGIEKSFVRLTNVCMNFSQNKTEPTMIDLAFGCHKHINLCDKIVKNSYFSIRWLMVEGVVNECISV